MSAGLIRGVQEARVINGVGVGRDLLLLSRLLSKKHKTKQKKPKIQKKPSCSTATDFWTVIRSPGDRHEISLRDNLSVNYQTIIN